MGLTRFTESFIPSIEISEKFTSRRKMTESDISQVQNQHSLQETSQELKEKTSVVNLSEKTVYKMPISRYDVKNANGRIYSKKLWENVINNQIESYVGGLGLADHPEGDKDGSFKEASVVYLNLSMNESNKEDEKLIFAECVFVGKYGKLAEEILTAGGRVGFSTSGFGELEESDNSTVNPNTFLLERVADIVLNPSQNVYGKKENVLTKESTIKNNKSVDSVIEEKKQMLQESSVAPAKFSKLEERQFRKDVKQFLAEASEIKNPVQRIDQLSEIKSYFSEGVASDLLDEVNTKLTEAHKEIDVSITEFSKLKETFDVDSTESIKEGVSNIAIDKQYYEKTAEEWKSIAKTMQEVNKKLKTSLDLRPTHQSFKEALARENELKVTMGKMIDKFNSDLLEAKSVIDAKDASNKGLLKELNSANSKVEALKETIQKYKTFTTSLKEKVSVYEEKIASHNEKILKEQELKNKIDITPRKESSSMFDGFNEKSEVTAYYKDLYQRHGKEIAPFKESILGCKTVKEAMRIYTKIFSEMGRNETTKISEAIPLEERQSLIESQTGMKIRTVTTNLNSRLPEGWI